MWKDAKVMLLETNQDNSININPKTIETYTKEDMIQFAWWLSQNMNQYSDDEHAHFDGKYFEMWKKNYWLIM